MIFIGINIDKFDFKSDSLVTTLLTMRFNVYVSMN